MMIQFYYNAMGGKILCPSRMQHVALFEVTKVFSKDFSMDVLAEKFLSLVDLLIGFDFVQDFWCFSRELGWNVLE